MCNDGVLYKNHAWKNKNIPESSKFKKQVGKIAGAFFQEKWSA